MMGLTTIISDATIEFKHAHPPRGAHKTYAKWLDRKLEKFVPIELAEATYHQLSGAMLSRGYNVLRERRSDNAIVSQIGDFVFAVRPPRRDQ